MLTGTCTETTKAVLFKHLHLSCTIYFRGDNFRSEYKQICEMQSHFTSTPFLMLTWTCTETTKAVLFKHLHLSCTIYFRGDNFRSEYKQVCEMQSHFTSTPFLWLELALRLPKLSYLNTYTCLAPYISAKWVQTNLWNAEPLHVNALPNVDWNLHWDYQSCPI